MNRTSKAAALLLTALALTACTTTAPAAQDPAPAPAAPAAEPAPYQPPQADPSDTAYLSTVRDRIPAFKIVDDDLLINAAERACEAIDAGVEPLTIIDMAMNSLDLDAYDAGFFIGAGIGVYCPEHMGALA